MIIHYDMIRLPAEFPFMLDDMDLPPYYSMGEACHWHDCFELSYAKSGRGFYEIEDRQYSFGSGELLIINNVEPHRMHVGKEGLRQVVMVFNPSLIWSGAKDMLDYEYLKAFVDRKEGFCNKISEENPYFSEINRIILQIESEYGRQAPGWQLMIKAQLMSLLTLLYRNFRSDTVSDTRRRALLRLRPVIHRIESSLAEPVRLADMAAMLHVTPQHFCVIFKETTGQTFVDYVRAKRISLAKEAFIHSDGEITQIAYECGFRNLSYFNKVFRETTGMTPSDFRKQRNAGLRDGRISRP